MMHISSRYPTDPSDSQTVDSSTSADEPTSVSSADVLKESKDQDQDQDQDEDEDEKDLDLEPASSSTQQPSRLPHRDSEPSAESPQCERAEETSLSPVHPPGNRCEDGDWRSSLYIQEPLTPVPLVHWLEVNPFTDLAGHCLVTQISVIPECTWCFL